MALDYVTWKGGPGSMHRARAPAQISGITKEPCLEGLTNMIKILGINANAWLTYHMNKDLGFSCLKLQPYSLLEVSDDT